MDFSAGNVAKAGFTYDSALGALDKLEEEVRELRRALEAGTTADGSHGVKEEVGDVLFAAANIARMAGVEGEEALHCACDKFVRRFAAVERTAEKPLGEYTEAEKLKMWADTKES